MRLLFLLVLLVACGDSPTAHDPLAASKTDNAIQDRLAGHTLRYTTKQWSVTWKLEDGTYAFVDSLNGDRRIWFNGPWWVRDSGFYFVREDGSENAGPGGIRLLPLEIRGESLYDESIEVVLNGFRYEVE